MLRHLTMRRFVFIREATVDFGDGFCVLTGETGAGKSLLADALALLGGARPAPGMIMPGAEDFELEAVFDVSECPPAALFLTENELHGDENDMLVRRIVDGKRSRAFINGRQVPLSLLSDAMSGVAEICGQHNHYSLRKPAAQQAFLDSCGCVKEASLVRAAHTKWSAADTDLRLAREQMEEGKLRRAALTEELIELEAVGFTEERWEEQNRLFSRLSNMQNLADGCAEAITALEDSATSGLSTAVRRLSELSRIDDKLAAPLQCAEEAAAAVNEAARTLGRYTDELGGEPQQLSDAENFIAESHRLARKYRLPSPSSLGECITEKKTEAERLDAQADIAGLEKTELELRKKFTAACKSLTQKRKTASASLEKNTTSLLRRLSMPQARLQVKITPSESPGAHGAERVELQITTRKDTQPGTIADVASGGELSRLGLALQLAADERGKPVMVFDEVDTGIGGAAASVVGELLQTLGKSRQVLCVTHLAQVAAHADFHLCASKDGDSIIREINGDARVEELARIVGGAKINDAARANAADLLTQAKRKS